VANSSACPTTRRHRAREALDERVGHALVREHARAAAEHF